MCPREVVIGRRSLDARFDAGKPCRPPRTAAAGRACIRVEGRLESVSNGRVVPKPSGPCGGPGWEVGPRCRGAGRRRSDCGRVWMTGHAFAWAVVTRQSRVGVSRRYCPEFSAPPRAEEQLPGGLGRWKKPWRLAEGALPTDGRQCCAQWRRRHRECPLGGPGGLEEGSGIRVTALVPRCGVPEARTQAQARGFWVHDTISSGALQG
jgi:hypothetical protein